MRLAELLLPINFYLSSFLEQIFECLFYISAADHGMSLTHLIPLGS